METTSEEAREKRRKRDRQVVPKGRNYEDETGHTPPYIQEEMFVAWVHKANARYVARACGVTTATVDKYRKMNRWDERLELIRAGATEKIDEMLEANLVLELHEISVLRKQAYMKAVKGEFDNAGQAYSAFINLCKLEQELKPAAEEEGVEDILVIARRRFLELREKEKKPETREIAAEIVNREEGAKEPQGDTIENDKPDIPTPAQEGQGGQI